MDKALQAFFLGDRIGAPFESQPGSRPSKSLTYEQIIARSNEYPNGTDESDIVMRLVEFLNLYDWDGDCQRFAIEWCDYHERHRRATKYGRTWRDHFRTVAAMRKRDGLDYEAMRQIALDRNRGGSAGNGCLALVYPLHLYAQKTGAEGRSLIRNVISLTHAHSLSLKASLELVDFFCGVGALEDLGGGFGLPLGREPEFNHLAAGCLRCAAIFAQLSTEEEVIVYAVNAGGDVDSGLALALLLWEVAHR